MKRLPAIVVMVIAGCKTSSTSSTRSLDNFARGEGAAVNVNTCSGPYGRDFDLYWNADADQAGRISVDSPLRDQLKEVIRETLTAVPDGLQDWFFDKGGRLVISAAASQTCSANAGTKGSLGEKSDDFHSCWTMADGQFPVIHLNADPQLSRQRFGEGSDLEVVGKDLRHSTVRAFGYVFSEVLSRLRPKDGSQTEFVFDSGDESFQKDKELLAWKFLNDLRNRSESGQGAPDLGNQAGLIQDRNVLNPKAMTYDQAWQAWFSQYKTWDAGTKTETWKTDDWARRAQRLQDSIFAEAFDSWYCNGETRKQLQGDQAGFKLTGGYFADTVVPAMEQVFAERSQVKTTSAGGEQAAGAVPAAGNPAADESEGPVVIDAGSSPPQPEPTAVAGHDAAAIANDIPQAPPVDGEPEQGLSLTGWRYPILRGLFAVAGALAYPARAVGQWAANRNERVSESLVRGQPIRNFLRILNGGPAGWRAQRWRETGGFQPIRRLQRGCLVRRWRC